MNVDTCIKMERYEKDNEIIYKISRKCQLPIEDIDFLIDCLQRNNKIHQKYIDHLSEHKNEVGDYFGPRSFVKAIYLQLSTIDWLYNLDCRVEDYYKKKKKEEKYQKEKERRKEEERKKEEEERKNLINNKKENTEEEKNDKKEEREEKIPEINVERLI